MYKAITVAIAMLMASTASAGNIWESKISPENTGPFVEHEPNEKAETWEMEVSGYMWNNGASKSAYPWLDYAPNVSARSESPTQAATGTPTPSGVGPLQKPALKVASGNYWTGGCLQRWISEKFGRMGYRV